MIKPPQLNQISREASQLVNGTIKELKQVAITSEEQIRKGIYSSVRTVVASVLFCVSAVVSFGFNVTSAIAHSSHKNTHSKTARTPRHSRHRHHRVANVAMESLSHSAAMLHTSSTGKASWYGGKFQHRRTASGKRFDTNLLMAAHKTLPFGTKVRVTNLHNAHSVVVEITDRGPYVGDRIIDVSHAAAVELGFANVGTADVRIEVLLTDELAESVMAESAD